METDLVFDDLEGGSNNNLDDDEFADYNIKSEYKQPVIVMEAVQDCRKKRATEMTKGFWNNKVDKFGNVVKVWMNDQRKEYINAVDALRILMTSELARDEKFINQTKKIQFDIKKLFEQFAYEPYKLNDKTGGWERSGIKYIPQLREEVLITNPKSPNTLVSAEGAWDNKVNAYYDLLVPHYDIIFGEICKVIDRLNHFQEQASF